MIKYDRTNYILKYWKDIESGKTAVSEKVRLIYKQLAADCKRKDWKYHFDISAAARPIYFIENFANSQKVLLARKSNSSFFRRLQSKQFLDSLTMQGEESIRLFYG